MPPKRRAPQDDDPAKRQRTTRVFTIGQSTAEDSLNEAQRSAQQPSSAALSTRHIPSNSMSSLVRISLRVFAQNLPTLLGDRTPDERRTEIARQTKRLPPHLIGPLFTQLQAAHPAFLSHSFIVNNFLQCENISLSADLPGVGKSTVLAIRDGPTAGALKTLELRDMSDLTDNVIASVLRSLPSLVTLILRGCTKVGAKSVTAAASTCKKLQSVNLNYTSPDIASLERLVTSCKSIENLKLAGVTCITDNGITRILGSSPSANFRALKLRQTSLTSSSAALLAKHLADDLTSLDISFTSVIFTSLPSTITKLSLTSTPILAHQLLALLPPLIHLSKLSLAALGGRTQSLTDSGLRSITATLEGCESLVELNLAGNAKLGLNGTGGVRDLLSVIGVRLEVLNLSAIPRLRSSDLEPLSEASSPPKLRTLSLSHTGLDDDAAPHIAACPSLSYLNLGGTRLSAEGVGSIVDACTQLAELDLTGCRGVDVRDRRRFFEAWEELRDASNASD